MAKVKDENLPLASQAFQDVWKVFKDNGEIEIDDDYFNKLSTEVKNAIHKYDNSNFYPIMSNMSLGMLKGFEIIASEIIEKQRIESYADK